MKLKQLHPFLIALIATVQVNAQCTASINYQNTPNGPTLFWADSIVCPGSSLTYAWDFGDGSTATGQQTSHIFQQSGMLVTYNVCLTLIDSATNNGLYTTCITLVYPDTAQSCYADVVYTNTDSLYSFTATCTGTAPFTYSWTVNGQNISTFGALSLVIDTLNNSNTVDVCVHITDANGCVSSNCAYISNANQPNPCNTYATYTNQDSLYTFFTTSIGGTPAVYNWTIDSMVVSTTGSSFTTVLTAGVHVVCVTVIDASGTTCSDCIYISNAPGGVNTCQAYFVIYPDSANGQSGVYYGFNYSSQSPNQNVLWNFGDGTTSTDPYPVHTYAQPGSYIVCLTIGSPNTTCYDTYCDSSFYVFKTEAGLMSQLTIMNPTGINETNEENNWSVYPNPVSDKLHLLSDEAIELVTIYTLQGRIALAVKQPGNMIHVADLLPGVYVLESRSAGQMMRTKLIKN
ncbi:MAG: PKD domain-containing protein [Bacteroidetes bacterium]|nr:PKD domain-containing protein [Bacteroidota bacterium]